MRALMNPNYFELHFTHALAAPPARECARADFMPML
jgi:hypothetical protein